MCVFKRVFSGKPSKAGDLFQPRQGQCKCRYLVLNTISIRNQASHADWSSWPQTTPNSLTYNLPRLGGGYNSMFACM